MKYRIIEEKDRPYIDNNIYLIYEDNDAVGMKCSYNCIAFFPELRKEIKKYIYFDNDNKFWYFRKEEYAKQIIDLIKMDYPHIYLRNNNFIYTYEEDTVEYFKLLDDLVIVRTESSAIALNIYNYSNLILKNGYFYLITKEAELKQFISKNKIKSSIDKNYYKIELKIQSNSLDRNSIYFELVNEEKNFLVKLLKSSYFYLNSSYKVDEIYYNLEVYNYNVKFKYKNIMKDILIFDISKVVELLDSGYFEVID